MRCRSGRAVWKCPHELQRASMAWRRKGRRAAHQLPRGAHGGDGRGQIAARPRGPGWYGGVHASGGKPRRAGQRQGAENCVEMEGAQEGVELFGRQRSGGLPAPGPSQDPEFQGVHGGREAPGPVARVPGGRRREGKPRHAAKVGPRGNAPSPEDALRSTAATADRLLFAHPAGHHPRAQVRLRSHRRRDEATRGAPWPGRPHED
mmetsp:Transcript_79385/g.220905  ORF Transcript_79385/g.220905 Transcript_79385/m.220905 type:complete len:205 (-) Transcript_79385:624-1238(-)